MHVTNTARNRTGHMHYNYSDTSRHTTPIIDIIKYCDQVSNELSHCDTYCSNRIPAVAPTQALMLDSVLHISSGTSSSKLLVQSYNDGPAWLGLDAKESRPLSEITLVKNKMQNKKYLLCYRNLIHTLGQFHHNMATSMYTRIFQNVTIHNQSLKH